MTESRSRAIGPLAGLRVIDLTRLAPGPFGTMLLGDLGADVITVEPPARPAGGPGNEALPRYGSAKARAAGLNPIFRSRRSIVVDLKSDAGKGIVKRLAENADVFIEGFRPGVADRLGVGYSDLEKLNPRLVYCSLTGYGQRGARAQRAGHDINYLAESGLLSTSTRPGQRPGIPLNMAADMASGGLLAAFGILAALRGRDQTGRGCYIDSNMVDGLLGMLACVPAWIAAGIPDPSWGEGLVNGAAPFYDCYQTSDGRWLSVGALESKFFRNLCEALGRPDLAELQLDEGRWNDIRTEFERIFATATLDQWLARLENVDTAYAPVRSVPEAFDFARSEGVVTGLCTLASLPHLEDWQVQPGPVVSQPGEHTREILRQLGVSDGDTAALLAHGVVMEAAGTAQVV